MKIAYVVETFTPGLGYIDNVLPRELSLLGNEVHLITCNLPPYYQNSAAFFGELTGPQAINSSKECADYQVHSLDFLGVAGRVLMKGLVAKLRDINPDVVVVRGIASPVLGQVIWAKFLVNFKIFTSTGQAYSAIPIELKRGFFLSKAKVKNLISRKIPGRVFSFFIKKCIGSSLDAADAVVDFYGVPRAKTTVIPLGVDTDIFFPAKSIEDKLLRSSLRDELGISDFQVVCIWTGRMTKTKSIELLASAVEELNAKGFSFLALFIGDGPESQLIKKYKYSRIIPFMPWKDLASYYRAADIAVWPKSITTSTLDASASGLPVILCDEEKASERWDGIGTTFKSGSLNDLESALLSYRDPLVRSKVGEAAVQKMRSHYSWKSMAQVFNSLFSQ